MCMDKFEVILFVFDSSKCNMSLFVLQYICLHWLMQSRNQEVKKYEYFRIFTNSNSTYYRNDVSGKFLNI